MTSYKNKQKNDISKVTSPKADISPFNLFSDNFLQPKMDMRETEKEFIVTAEIPGVTEKDIEIAVSEDGFLKITAEKKEEKEEHTDGLFLSERSYGSVQRMVPLPAEIDVSKATADFENGVLTIDLPKSEAALKKVKKISVKKKK